MKKIRNLTIILLSFIIMLCIGLGVCLLTVSSARADDARTENSLTSNLARDYPALAKGTRYIVGPVSMMGKYANVGNGITYVAYGSNDTFFNLTQKDDGGVYFDYVKVSAVNWPSDGMVHLIIPKEVTHILPGCQTDGDTNGDCRTFHQSELNVYSIEFETGSAFTVLGDIAATGESDTVSNLLKGQVFGPNSNLRKITFPDNGVALTIGNYAFYQTTARSSDGSAGLQSVKILNKTSVRIGECAFQGCVGLRTFDADLNCQGVPFADEYDADKKEFKKPSIRNNAFNGCFNLYRAVLPGGLGEIAYQAFMDCKLLSDVLIPDTVKTLGPNAFANSGLVRVKLVDGVSLYDGSGAGSFANCPNLVEVETNVTPSHFWTANYETNVFNIVNDSNSSNILRTKEGLVFAQATAANIANCLFLNYNGAYQIGTWYLGGYCSPTARSNKWNTFDKLTLPDAIDENLSVYEMNYVSDVYEDEYNGREFDYLAIKKSEGKYEVDFVKNARPTVAVENYDIARRVFYDKYVPYVEISKAVVNIGNLAFNGSRLTSLVMGENVTTIGYGALDTESTGLTVYIKNNQQSYGTAFNGAEPTESNPVYFIYENKFAYDGKIDVNYYVGNDPQKDYVIHTYIVPVHYTVGGKQYTEYRLHKKEYAFVRKDNNLWGTDYNLQVLNSLRNLAEDFFGEDACEDYASTVWYKEDKYENTANVAYIDTQLAAEQEEIKIFTKKVTKAEIDKPKGGTFDETYTWTNGSSDIVANISYSNIKGESKSADDVHHAGKYEVNFTLDSKWGEWVSSEIVELAITQREINLASGDYAWKVNGEDFQKGTVYGANGTYTTYSVNGATEHGGVNFVPYMNSSDKYTVAVTVNNNAYDGILTLTYADNEKNCNANGEYKTTVDLSLVGDNANNYNLSGIYNSSVTWYIAEYANEIKEGYAIADFTFGDEGASFPVPEAKYNSTGTTVSFTLKRTGKATAIVSGKAVTATDGYGYYINCFMPAGRYELTITVGAATSGSITYVEYGYEFGFEVGKASFDGETVEALNTALKAEQESAHGTNYYLYDATVTAALTAINGKLIKPAVNTYWGETSQASSFATSVDFYYTATGGNYFKYDGTNGFNAIGEYTVYYNLQAANYDDLVDIHNSTERDAHSYKLVIYENMEPFRYINTDALTWIAAGVEVKPNVTNDSRYNITWTDTTNYYDAGEHTVTLTSNNPVLYRWNITATVQNEFSVERVGNTQSQSIKFTYKLKQATNQFIMSPTMSGWEYGQFENSGITLSFRPMYYDYVTTTKQHPYTVNFYEYSETAEGNKGAELGFSYESFWSGTATGRITFTDDVYEELKALRVGTYVAEVKFDASPNFTNRLTGRCTFVVSKGINRFTELSIAGWAWNSFNATDNSPVLRLNKDTTDAQNGKYVSLKFSNNDDGKTIYYADRKFYDANGAEYADIKTFFNGFEAGLWTLEAAAPEDDDVARATSSIQFTVILADNGWRTAPSILGWQFGSYDFEHNFTEGETVYNNNGSALERTYYSDEAKQAIITDLDKYLNALSADDNYVLVVHVAGVDGKFAPMDYTLKFSVAKGVYDWKSSSEEASYQPEMTIQNPVYGSTDGLGVTVPKGERGKDYSYTATYHTVINGAIMADGKPNVPTDAGNYAVVVTIKRLKDGEVDGNYLQFEETLYFNISQKVSSFNGDDGTPAPVNGSTESQAYNSISIPTVNVVDAAAYDLSYVVALQGASARAVAASKTCSSAQEVVAFIQENGIGTYTVTFTATSKDNNYANFQTVTTYVIGVAQNSWDANSVYLSAEATYGQKPVLEAFINAGGQTVTYAIADEQISETTIDGFMESVKNIDAGVYTVTVSTAAGNWTGLSERFTLTVNRAADSWKNKGQLNNGTLSWDWGTRATFTRPDATNGNVYALAIIDSSGATVATPANEDGVETELGKLDAGSYTLTVTASGNKNYNSISTAFEFTVIPAENEITSLSMEGWTYGAAAKNPVCEANHGSAVFTYEKQNGSGWVSVSAPVDAGTYRVIATVAQTGNYSAATKNAEFTIARAEATISGLTIGGFQWNGYDKTTFVAATTDSPSAISYAIYSGTAKLFDLGLDGNGLPDDESVAAMNGLVAGSYRLVASTAVSTNYNATSTGTDAGNFTVTMASNGWLITPNIRSWVHYEFDDEVNMPVAVPQYGNISVTITNERGATVYSGTISVTVKDGEYVYAHTGNTAGLWNAPGGLYTLTVTVSGENNKYNGMTSSVVFDIFTGSASRPQNYWEEVPSIDSWTSEYQSYTVPMGVPVRWTTVTHEYYEAERTANGFVAGEEILATVTRTFVGAGSADKIEIDGVMPAKPGWYMVVYTSTYEDVDGTVYEADSLSYTVYFQILEAENSWVETPNIENWTLNGAASVPTTGSAMYDSDYVITYRPFDDPDAVPVEDIPTTAGRYVMIVTAKAKVDGEPSRYCKDIVSEVVFTVSLATNEWVVLPTIEGWSEEFSDLEHNPVAEAKAGTVTYYYYDGNHKLLEEQPTAAGTYYLVAEVEAEGYEKLSSEVEFTITAAWDETLILIDIVLGVAACAATVVAIIFAKRRKSQC